MERSPTSDYELEPEPEILTDRPDLLLAWRGICISIANGKVTRTRAEELLNEWATEDPNNTRATQEL